MIRLVVLIVLIAAVWRVVRSFLPVETTSEPRRPQASGWDPHAVLGVPRGASADDVTRAYREQMKQYHPDRVANLGPELQELAHKKTVEIQRAYDQLKR